VDMINTAVEEIYKCLKILLKIRFWVLFLKIKEISRMECPASYGSENIQILEGLEAVRKRPSMYIGSTGIRGLHHLVFEVVDNGIDEILAGRADAVNVIINEDNSITVVDNGGGIPVDRFPEQTFLQWKP
jgi:hypothetical protein